MFDKIQEMQAKMDEIKARLETIEVKGEADGVSVIVTGNKKVKNVNIDPAIIAAGDAEQIEDLLIAATNRALDQAEAVYETEMKAVAGSMLPGLGSMFGM